ncbi:ankyrin repeat domain-containing protein [Mycoavidus sp. B2-EB]|uniref:ankyrin repeat domain-containing protein n=1 Tax=Mycoavidus sp. B2-EB TaxID=2651972 RepID=UPI0016265E19|nr:ankyrin repeat domain-containing protein [Mycoavidus sp. B2-EB]BBO60433.1 hypothetical protein MPB2EB_1574 [Mycoavidus sp. B2-EB]
MTAHHRIIAAASTSSGNSELQARDANTPPKTTPSAKRRSSFPISSLLENKLEKSSNSPKIQGESPSALRAPSPRPYILKSDSDKELSVKNMSAGERSEELLKALLQGDRAMMDLLLKYGVDVNLPNDKGDLPIHCAAMMGDVDALRSLVNKGAKLSESKPSLLEIAEFQGEINVFALMTEFYFNDSYIPKSDSDKKLLANNMSDAERKEALSKASLQNDSVMENILLEYEASINLQNDKNPEKNMSDGERIEGLNRARPQGDSAMKNISFEYKVNINLQNAKSNSSISHVAKEFYFNDSYTLRADPAKELLVKNMSAGERSKELHRSLLQGDKTMMDLLLKYGVDVNSPNDKGDLPIHYAAARGDVYALRRLVDMGAELNKSTAAETSILEIAEFYRVRSVLAFVKDLYLNGQFIPQHDADKLLLAKYINAAERKPALCRAINQDDIQMVNALFKRRIDVNFKSDKDNNTPAHLAAKIGNQEILKSLLDAGANPNVENAKGEVVLKVVLNSKSSENINLLKDFYSRHPKLLDEAKYISAIQWDREMMRFLFGYDNGSS